MVNFDKILTMAKKLANLVLRGEKIERKDMGSELFSDEDKDYVIDHLSDPDKIEVQNNLARELYKNRNKDWKKVEAAIRPPERKVKYLHLWGRVAAIFIGVMTIGLLWFSNRQDNKTLETPDSQYNITLQLPDGSIKILEEKVSGDIEDKKGRVVGVHEESRINYRKGQHSGATAAEYHQLKVPFGKTFEVVLSDGTRVSLNAGSSLKYPVHFGNDKNRKVLLEGEAYFDVEKNPAQPFIVHSGDINVRVLGTKFVMNSYQEESRIRTVLLEGSVALFEEGEDYHPEKSALLEPGQKATWDKEQKNISLEEVDTDLYTGWMEGRLIFNHVAFNEILRRLERHYNVSVVNKNEALGKEVFTASFEKESIENVLNSFSRNYPFEYTINNKGEITINP